MIPAEKIDQALDSLGRLAAQDPILAALARLPEGRGVCLVGGVVRDALLNPDRGFKEIDLAVPVNALDLAAGLAKKTGAGLIVLSEKEDTARLVPKEHSGPAVDLTGFRGSHRANGPAEDKTADLIVDLKSRDFTINTLAVDLAELRSGRPRLIDPLGGLADLAARRLIPAGSWVLRADPLRVWRGLRLSAQLGLQIPEATWRALAAATPGMGRVAGERQAQELRLLLAQPDTAELWRRAADAKLLGLLLPEIGNLAGVYQNRYHHLNGLDHTIDTLARVEALISKLPSWAVKAGWRPQAGIIPALKLAALFHDAGKPARYRIRPDGGLSFPGHEKLGAKIWQATAERLKLSRVETRLVKMLIACHMRPLHLLLEPEITAKARRKLIKKADGRLAELGLLALADSYASQGPARDPGWEDRLNDLWADLLALEAKMNHQAREPLLTGGQVMDHLNIPSGPLVGRLLSELAEARLTGPVASREQALAWLENRFDQLID